jgi:hypothetical protein
MSKRVYSTMIAAIICSVFIIFLLTNLILDPYIKATNWGVNLFEFYQNNKDTNKIYFIGDSLAVHGINPITIEKFLLSNNQSYKVYSVAYPQDLPLNRIFELPNIVMSKPKIIVICFHNSWLWPHDDFFTLQQNQQDDYAEKRFLLASDKINIDSYERTLFNRTELSHVKMDPLHLTAYKRRFLKPAIQLKLSGIGLINYEPNKASFDLFDFRNQIEETNKTIGQLKEGCYYNLSEEDNRNRKCFRYIINYLRDHGIYVILVSMPLNPGIEKCKNNANIFANFVKSVRCPYYDLETLCSGREFQDAIHVNDAGRKNLTKEMAKILSIEAKNVSE